MPKKVHAAHILVKTNEEANSIMFDLNRGASFEDIAKAREDAGVDVSSTTLISMIGEVYP